MALHKNFLQELLKLCFKNKNVIEVCKQHLNFTYLPTEEYKELWKYIKNYYISTAELPSLGIVSQAFKFTPKILDLINKIKESQLISESQALEQLEEYIRDSMSVDFGQRYAEMWNNGKKKEAQKLLIETSEKIHNFSLNRDTNNFEPIFKGFYQRYLKRKNTPKERILAYFGIDDLDDKTGGLAETDMALFAAQSGVGKTKWLQHIGVHNARRGRQVMHLQLEGSKEDAEDGYDSCWSGQRVYNIERGFIEDDVLEILNRSIDELLDNVKGEIKLYAPEKFGAVTCADLRAYVLDYIKIHGKAPDLILIDYFELLDPGDGKTYSTGVEGEKARRRAIGRLLKNICTEFKTRIITATQASTVAPANLEDPEFVMTRYDISGDKSQLDPFTFFFTLNQTPDEYKEGVMRIHVDKARKARKWDPIRIWQSYEFNKFYDRAKTLLKAGINIGTYDPKSELKDASEVEY